MNRPTKIVAATDLSRSALEAARRAALLAREHDAILELLHVIPYPFASDAWNEIRIALKLEDRDFRNAARRRVEEDAARIEKETGVTPVIQIAEGKPFAAIAARCSEARADLLVVGAHGESFLLDPFLGTTAHRVLRFATVPVLLVKQSSAQAYERAIVATDFSADSAYAAQCASQTLPRVDLTLFHAYEVPFEGKLTYAGVSRDVIDDYRRRAEREARKQLDEFAAAAGLRDASRAVRYGPAALRIREYATDAGADLIVCGAQGRSAIGQALLGSVSLRLVTEAPCDLLLVKAASN